MKMSNTLTFSHKFRSALSYLAICIINTINKMKTLLSTELLMVLMHIYVHQLTMKYGEI